MTARTTLVTTRKRSPVLIQGLVLALIIEHVALIVAPVDVLSPIDPHHLGQLMLHGHVPYRDFLFEYPPFAALAFLLPGLLPGFLGLPTMALQATLIELTIAVVILRRHTGALVRYALLSLLVFPFLSGGFDAVPMAALVLSTALLADRRGAGWWVATGGALTKVSPASAWVWARRPWKTGVVALVITLTLALAPAVLATHPDDSYIGYNFHRGVEVESVAASTAWVVQQIERQPTRIVYRFRSNELPGADNAAVLWFALMTLALALLALRSGRHGHPDPWLASFVAVLWLMAGSKVLSPQYIGWLAPIAAVVGGRWWKAWMVVAGLTAAVYALNVTNTQLLALTLVRNLVLVITAGLGLRTLLYNPVSPAR